MNAFLLNANVSLPLSRIHYLIININYNEVNYKCITYQFYQDLFGFNA